MTAGALVLGTILLLGGQTPAPPPAQAAPPPTGLILGRVLDAATNRPVAGAIVALDSVGMIMPGVAAPRPSSLPRAMTNAAGQFVFRKLPKGSYGLSASKIGYADGAYGRRKPGGSQVPLELDGGQRTGDVVIRVWRYASISGTVVDEAGEPLVGVQVRAFTRRLFAGRRRFASASTAVTDDRGMYRFGSLVPGEYVVAFVAREVSVPATVTEMMRAPALPNDPKFAEMMRERMTLGAGMGTPGTSSATQVGNLVRQLDLSAPVPPIPADAAPLFVYPTQFYPAVATAARATVVTLESGQQRESVDLALRPIRAVRISGSVIGPDGPAAHIALRLVPGDDEARTELEQAGTMSGASGEFTFLGVTPGQYTIKVLRVPRPAPSSNAAPVTTTIQIGNSTIMSSVSGAPGGPVPEIPDAPTLFGEVPVSAADADVTDVVVTLQRGARVTGRYEFDGTREHPAAADLTRFPVLLERTDATPPGAGPFNNIPPGHADASGTFKTFGVPPGKYLIRMGGVPPGWTMKSATADGRDVADTPLDLRATDVANVVITFTDKPTTLTGTARGGNGEADREGLVVVFPADQSGWSEFGLNPRRLRSTRPSKTGSYTFSGLPAGDYYVAAIREEMVGQWQDPQVLEELSRSATLVRLLDGDTRTQDVKTPAGPR